MPTTSAESTSILKPTAAKINWKYQYEQYGAALIAAITWFIILSFYLLYRRGYYNLYIANKVLVGAAAIFKPAKKIITL